MGFHIPELPPGKFAARSAVEASAQVVDATLEKAQAMWPQIERVEVANALACDFSNEDPPRALALLQYYFGAQKGSVISVSGEQRQYSGGSSMLQQLKQSFDRKPKRRGELRGAQNLGGVSCYMDSTLSAMFSRMENFEPLLYQTFDNPEKNELATWLRVFVNMQRSGELVTRDIMRGVLASCYKLGWCTAEIGHQQDAGEFFSFLTETLHMPLLSLRVEIAHAGREVAEDDHKLVTEQLLFLPVPGGPQDGPILLEECLELYFANNISVSRPCGGETGSIGGASGAGGASPLGGNVANGTGSSRDRTSDGGTLDRRSTFGSVVSALDSPRFRHRSYSIVSTTTVKRLEEEYANSPLPTDSPSGFSHRRQSSLAEPPTYTQLFGETKEVIDRKNQLWTNKNEITFPAWMFLQLMPFYADPEGGKGLEGLQHIEAQQVATHFEQTRPVLGMCLKRFGYDEQGSTLNSRKVVIPHTIFLPSFVADDSDNNEVFGSFKLVLESVVFHKGNTNHSGHYTSLVRDDLMSGPGSSGSQFNQKGLWRRRSKRGNSDGSIDEPERWLLFDDMQNDADKVQQVDFQSSMDSNMPYLLFYRMVALEPVVPQSGESQKSQLSPIISPQLHSAPVSPGTTPQVPAQVPSAIALAGGGGAPERAPAPAAPAAAAAAEPKKKKGLFRKHHKEKDYASAYREEKCSIM